MTRTFAITFDYLCPFARNAAEHVITALEAGADWDVEFLPYSLAQGHVEADETDVWDREDPYEVAGVLALSAGLAVRDHWPERFLAAHRELFAARHDRGENIKDREVVRSALERAGLDADAVLEAVGSGEALTTLHKEHERGVRDHEFWGVPTFVAGDRANFVRLMTRPDGDADYARTSIERVLDLVVDFPELHEFKQTDLNV
ncbi:MAG: DsbA family protein [Nitriliruptorales bacterium]|nr:DsbA family protein [Nitriliruptorales bacterium]